MNVNFAFFKKEIKEILRAPRYITLFILFVAFGILSPATAKFMNEIFVLFAVDIPIVLPDPHYLDAWEQIFKNTNTLLIIVYMIMLSGSIVSEKIKGSILLVLSKNVSRSNFVLSKVFAGYLVFFVCFTASLLIGMLYTQILFQEVWFSGAGYAILLSYLMGLTFTAIAIFVSIVSKSSTIAALLGFVGFTVLSIFTVIPQLFKFNPLGATELISGIMHQTVETVDIWINVGAMVVFFGALVGFGIYLFKRQEL